MEGKEEDEKLKFSKQLIASQNNSAKRINMERGTECKK